MTGLSHCPPIMMAARAGAASAFAASGSAASMSRLFSGPMPSVHSPLRTYDYALRVLSESARHRHVEVKLPLPMPAKQTN